VSVDRGTAAVTTTDGMPAQAAQITVAPKDKAATYEIARLNNQVVITSHTGALLITEAGATTELAEGSSSSRTADPTPAPAPAPVPQAAPVFPGSTLSGKQVFVIGAVVAGAAVAVGLWAGMSAAGVPPGGFGNQLSGGASHQGRGLTHVPAMARVASVARVASPVAVSVANGARNSAALRAAPPAQHRGVRAGR
jgi:hypothetical protein